MSSSHALQRGVEILRASRRFDDSLIERFAKFLEAILDLPSGSVTRRQAMHVMIGLKQCRDLTTPQRDNEVDICGYAHLLQMDREAAVPVGEHNIRESDAVQRFKEAGADLTMDGARDEGGMPK